MTATLTPPQARPQPPEKRPATAGQARSVQARAPYLVRGALLALAAVLLGVAVQLVLLSPLQHRAAQATAFDDLRATLALGTAPVQQETADGKLIAPGTPLLKLDIPRLKLHQVVFEGTSSDVLAQGPGHRRDTLLPGQSGVSVIMGRAAAYGGPFGDLGRLQPGDEFKVTTGQGVFHYRVRDLRRAGDPSPALPAVGQGRLVLVTATGPAFLPEHVLRVDADLVGKPADTPPAFIAADSIPAEEQPMAGGSPHWFALVLWLQALALVAVAAVWCWFRWGRQQTWIVFTPLVGVVGLQVAEQVTRLLPNLL